MPPRKKPTQPTQSDLRARVRQRGGIVISEDEDNDLIIESPPKHSVEPPPRKKVKQTEPEAFESDEEDENVSFSDDDDEQWAERMDRLERGLSVTPSDHEHSDETSSAPALTARQRAARSTSSHTATDPLLQEEETVEQETNLLKKSEAARKKKMSSDKRAEELKWATVQKLLHRQAAVTKRAKGEQAQQPSQSMTMPLHEKKQQLAEPIKTIRYVLDKNGPRLFIPNEALSKMPTWLVHKS